MLGLLQQKGLLAYVKPPSGSTATPSVSTASPSSSTSGTGPVSLTITATTGTGTAAFVFDVLKDEMAKGLLILHVSDTYLDRVQSEPTAHAAWQALERIHNSTIRARIMQMRKELNSLRMQSDQDVNTYHAYARTLANALKQVGVTIADGELVETVLGGLPPAFDSVVQHLTISTVSSATPLSYDDLLPILLVTEQTIRSQEAAATALAARSVQYAGSQSQAAKGKAYRGPKGSKGRGAPTGAAADSHSASTSGNGNPHANVRCHKCKILGHVQRNCPQRKSGTQSQPGQHGQPATSGSSQQSQQAPRPAHTLALTALAAAAIPSLSGMCILDTGASEHIFCDRSLFCEYSAYSSSSAGPTIVFGDGKHASAIGHGSIMLPTSADSEYDAFKLGKVLYVPDAAANMLSVSQLLDVGLIVSFGPTSATVTFHGRPVAIAQRDKSGWVIPAVSQATARSPPATAAVAVASTQIADAQLWHARFGHTAYSSLETLAAKGMVANMPVEASAFKAAGSSVCETCATTKQPRTPFPSTGHSTTALLGLVHMDVCGPMPTPSLGGSLYTATFVDEYSKYSVVRNVRYKSDIPQEVIKVLTAMAVSTGHTVRAVRSDRGTEYLNHTTEQFFTAKGIQHQTSAAYTPQQNGTAERLNRTLLERARAMLTASGLPANLWAEAITTSNLLRNLSPAAGLDCTPWEMFNGQQPDVSMLRVFGCPAFVRVPAHQRNKLQPTAVKGIFVGYEPGLTAYRVLVNNKMLASRDVIFDEQPSIPDPDDEMPAMESECDSDTEDDAMPPALSPAPPGSPAAAPAGHPSPAAAPTATPPDPALPKAAATTPRYPRRERQFPDFFKPALASSIAFAAGFIPEPSTFSEAMHSEHAEQWQRAADEEMESLMTNNTWELVDLPPGCKAIPCKWLFKVKLHADGSIERFKARLVAKGFMQREGIDFTEVFAPTSKLSTLRLLLAHAAAASMHIRHLDVKTAFLNGELDETIYMQQPPGYVTNPHQVCYLRKSLYGLRQAPRAWYHKLKGTLEAMGFTASSADPSLYVMHTDSSPIYLLVWVDDIIVFSHQPADSVVQSLQSAFDVRDLGQVTYVLGMQIVRNLPAHSIHVSQPRLISELVTRYSMDGAKPRSVPMSPATKLIKTVTGAELNTAQFPYSELVGSLLYIAVSTRLDIAFAVGSLARYMANPSVQHWQAACDVLRYLAHTSLAGITYCGTDSTVRGFSDADFAGDISTRRSTTGYVFTCNSGSVSWSSRLQPTIAVSTTEAEYMAASSATKEALWLRTLLSDLGLQSETISIADDSQGAIKLLKHPIASQRSKHIDVLHHFVRERVALRQVSFSYVPTEAMLADVLTKPLPPALFSKHAASLGIGPP